MDHTTPLGSLLGSEVRARIVVHFVVHPHSRLSARELGRRAGVTGKRSLQIEVDRLVGLGLLRRDRVGRVVHIARDSHAQWGALASLAQEYAPTLILREALTGVPGVEAAFVFGSYARGDARPDSDIDLFVYGDEIPEGAVGKALLDAALVLDRPVDAKRYDAPAFQRDARPGASFLPGALSGPKLWLVGSADRLPATGAARG
jgi:predicted nucleotidyltransferase